MFPYNDYENEWISKPSSISKRVLIHNLPISLFFAFFVALLSIGIPTILYFLRIN